MAAELRDSQVYLEFAVIPQERAWYLPYPLLPVAVIKHHDQEQLKGKERKKRREGGRERS